MKTNEILTTGLTILIPMFNEEDNVQTLLEEIQMVMADHIPYEIVVIDDSSTDATFERLKQVQSTIAGLRIVRHRRNLGQSNSLVSGVYAARYPWIATLDGDGQNNPEDILKLAQVAADADKQNIALLIAGHRNKRNDSWIRKISSKIANGIRSSLLKDQCPDTGCGLKLFRREDFLKLPHFDHLHRFLPALYRRAEGQVFNVPVSHRPRMKGQSKYGIRNRLWIGIIDLFGVSWLIRRPCRLNEVAERVD